MATGRAFSEGQNQRNGQIKSMESGRRAAALIVGSSFAENQTVGIIGIGSSGQRKVHSGK